MNWIAGFGHQALALGALLAAVPLLIHIFNRQRHAPMPWAGMRFVMAAFKKTRRRSQFENLLLLLLRMAAIALLAFALSRPFTSSDSPLAQLTEERRDLVLIIDSSASTGYRQDIETVYERIVDRARTLISELKGGRGDRVRLIKAAATSELLSWRSPEDALSLLSTLSEPSDEALDLHAALIEVQKFAEADMTGAESSSIEVRLLTDYQRGSFTSKFETDTEAAPDATASSAPLDRLAELSVKVFVEDLGPSAPTPANLGVQSVRVIGPILGPGMPTEIGVSVMNFGATRLIGRRLALFVDGERQPSRQFEVAARSVTEEVFSVSFATSGYHVVEARLDGDGLSIDDSRHRLLFIPPPIQVLLVNGDPKTEIDEDEVGYLRAVLAPLDDGGLQSQRAPFQPVVIAPEALGHDDQQLDSVDVVFLANVESLTQRVVTKLEEFVSKGGSLILSLGDRVSPESYNARLWRSDRTGLLPAELLRRVEVNNRRESYFRAATFDGTHPILSFFNDERWRPLFSEAPIYAFISSNPVEDARVLARVDDEEQSPLLIERQYDQGRVYLWTTSIDKDWTRLPESPRSLVPFVHELIRHAGQPRVRTRNIGVGEMMTLEVEHFPRSAQINRPDGTSRTLDGTPEELPGELWRLPPLPLADQAGLWSVELDSETVSYSVQFDSEEGDLSRLSASELGALHPTLVAIAPSNSESKGNEGEHNRSGELWRGFARACLIALILESLWAGFIGRRRRWTT